MKIKTNNFRGDLSDISAVTATLQDAHPLQLFLRRGLAFHFCVDDVIAEHRGQERPCDGHQYPHKCLLVTREPNRPSIRFQRLLPGRQLGSDVVSNLKNTFVDTIILGFLCDGDNKNI